MLGTLRAPRRGALNCSTGVLPDPAAPQPTDLLDGGDETLNPWSSLLPFPTPNRDHVPHIHTSFFLCDHAPGLDACSYDRAITTKRS